MRSWTTLGLFKYYYKDIKKTVIRTQTSLNTEEPFVWEKIFKINPIMHNVSKMVRHTLKTSQQMLQDF